MEIYQFYCIVFYIFKFCIADGGTTHSFARDNICAPIFRSKFSYDVTCYMLELYNDKLLDLFVKPGTQTDVSAELLSQTLGLVQRVVLLYCRLECRVHDALHIYPLCGIFFFPWHRHHIEETYSVSSEIVHMQCGVNELAKVSKQCSND